MSTNEFKTLRSQIETIENNLNYVKSKVNEPSKLGQGQEAEATIQSLRLDLEQLKGEIAEKNETLRMNNNLCAKIKEQAELMIKQIELAHEEMQTKYGFSFADESERSEASVEGKPFASFDASPVSDGVEGRPTASGLVASNGKGRRLNFEDLGLLTPFASSTCKKNGRGALTPGVRLLPPSPSAK